MLQLFEAFVSQIAIARHLYPAEGYRQARDVPVTVTFL